MAVASVSDTPPKHRVLNNAQWWSNELMQANTYLTTGDAAGFALHWDDHDVIVVQLAGEKNWEVRGFSRPAPMYRDAAANLEPSEEIVWAGTLRAGDVMHIPRGYWHQATRQDQGNGFSLHVTFGFAKRTGVDWLTWLADARSREDERFRRDLARWSPDDQVQELGEEAAQLVKYAPFPTFLATREQERPSARHVATHGLFGKPSAVVCMTEFRPLLDKRDDKVIVSAAGKKVTFAMWAMPGLRLLLSGYPVEVDAVASATGLDLSAIVDVLVEEDICAEVTAELAAGAGLVS